MDLQHFGYKIRKKMEVSVLVALLSATTVIGAIVYGILKFYAEYKGYKSDEQRKSEYISSFNDITTQLSSNVETTQLSAAILCEDSSI